MDSLLNKMPGVAEVEYLISALESKGAFYSEYEKSFINEMILFYKTKRKY